MCVLSDGDWFLPAAVQQTAQQDLQNSGHSSVLYGMYQLLRWRPIERGGRLVMVEVAAIRFVALHSSMIGQPKEIMLDFTGTT